MKTKQYILSSLATLFLACSANAKGVPNNLGLPSPFGQPVAPVKIKESKQTSLNYPLCLLEGEWEAQIPSNKYRLQINWSNKENRFVGHLTRQGNDSYNVGFKVGEFIYTAEISDRAGILEEKAKFRSGSNGVSNGFEFRNSLVDLTSWKSPDDGIFYNGTLMRRVSELQATCLKQQ